MVMKIIDNLEGKTLLNAKKLHHYNELLIAQCNSWLPEEVGNKNMEKQIIKKNNLRNSK
jgi:hypothetical protein